MSNPPMPNRAARRHAPKDVTVLDAIERAKRGGKSKPPDGASILEPTPEQIAEAQDAMVRAAAGETPPPAGGGSPADAIPLDPSQMPPELIKQLENMQSAIGGPGAAPAAGGTVASTKARRAKKYLDLEKELAVVLMLPAMPAEMAGDQYCAMHFATQGPVLAFRLTLYAETHEATFKLLCQIVEAGGIFTLIIAVAGYALPPLLHHGMPAPQGLKSMYHVPHKVPAQAQEAQDG
jgi:hypothetical protein